MGMPPRPRLAPLPPPVVGARWVALTKSKFALVDASDYERINRFAWHCTTAPGRSAYAKRQVSRGVFMPMQNEVLSAQPGEIVDHIDRNGLDNRRSNLRRATPSQNQFNSKRRRDNTSGYKGVCTARKRWRAEIKANGKRIRLGTFGTPEEAARAYNAAALRLHGQFALLNKID